MNARERLVGRRTFIKSCGLGTVLLPRLVANRKDEKSVKTWYTVAKLSDRWLLQTPSGDPFFAVSFNHIDSSALRYPENVHLWKENYGSSDERWIKERVAPDLRSWGFNSIGWTQEVVLREKTYHWHSQNWTRDYYNWAGLPYFHTLPFVEAHRWKLNREWPDVFSEQFARWCDYVARENCAALADDPNLIGYYFTDVPLLVQLSKAYPDKETIFNPELLNSKSGREEIAARTRQYYKVATEAVRRYDPNHLIFGDRYNLARAIPEPVIDAAKDFVDAISFQLGPPQETVSSRMRAWSERTGLPFIVADATTTAEPDPRLGGGRHSPDRYRNLLESMRDNPWCVGVNLCGGFVRNRVRKKGIYDELENPDRAAIEGITKVNREIATWYRALASTKN